MGRGSRRLGTVGWAFAAAVLLAVGLFAVRGEGFGEIDGVGALVGALSLALAAWSVALAVRAWRWQETDARAQAARLADQIRHDESQARRQLLGNSTEVIDLVFDLRPASSHISVGAPPDGTLAGVSAYFTTLRPRRLVITGEPGSGKTVLAVELMLALLEEWTPEMSVPVRLSAASWPITAEAVPDSEKSRIVESWLARHLIETYRMPKLAAAALVNAQLVLPVVDGLDEMDATGTPGFGSRAGRAVAPLNAYQATRKRAAVVITCRTGQYDALEHDGIALADAARVDVRPVTPTDAWSYLTDRVTDTSRWEPVLDALTPVPGAPPTALARALTTPWRLTVAATVYEQRHPLTGAYLRDPGTLADVAVLGTPTAVRDHLLSQFIPASLAALDEGVQPGPGRADLVHRRLAVLAAYLNSNAATGRTVGGRPLSGSDIVLHELWPMLGDRAVRAVAVGLIAAPLLVLTSVFLASASYGLDRGLVMGGSLQTAAFAYWMIVSWWERWPEVSAIDLGAIRTRTGRRRAVFGLGGGLGGGLALGLVFGFEVGLATGLAVGLASGFGYGLQRFGATGSQPHRIAFNDLAAGLAYGLTCGLVFGLAYGLIFGSVFGLAFWLAYGHLVGLAGGLSYRLAGTRYLALLRCTRRWSGRALPWRLGRFLDRCYRAGLVRVAGGGYQFRHRELQDHLAAHSGP